MHSLCLFTSFRGHTLHLHLPASHTDLMQTLTMEELLISPGWSVDISCYLLPRWMLIAVLVSGVRWQKPANKTSTSAFYVCPHLATHSVWSQLKWYHPSWSRGLFSPRLKITNFMFWQTQGMSQLYHSSCQWRKCGEFIILEMKELNRDVRGSVATSTHVTIPISHASNNWWTESI